MKHALLLCLLALPALAQWRTASDVSEGSRGSIVGTIVDIDEGSSQLQITADDDRHSRIPVIADTLSTQYNGFGGVINGQPEIFVGTKGFSNLRLGDRVEVRGIGRGKSRRWRRIHHAPRSLRSCEPDRRRRHASAEHDLDADQPAAVERHHGLRPRRGNRAAGERR